jgi:hypothetical protein
MAIMVFHRIQAIQTKGPMWIFLQMRAIWMEIQLVVPMRMPYKCQRESRFISSSIADILGGVAKVLGMLL